MMTSLLVCAGAAAAACFYLWCKNYKNYSFYRVLRFATSKHAMMLLIDFYFLGWLLLNLDSNETRLAAIVFFP